jgi:hypothetical protein
VIRVQTLRVQEQNINKETYVLKDPLARMRLLLSQNVFSEAYDEEKEKLTSGQYMIPLVVKFFLVIARGITGGRRYPRLRSIRGRDRIRRLTPCPVRCASTIPAIPTVATVTIPGVSGIISGGIT